LRGRPTSLLRRSRRTRKAPRRRRQSDRDILLRELCNFSCFRTNHELWCRLVLLYCEPCSCILPRDGWMPGPAGHWTASGAHARCAKRTNAPPSALHTVRPPCSRCAATSRLAARPRDRRCDTRKNGEGKFSSLQTLEKTRNVEIISADEEGRVGDVRRGKSLVASGAPSAERDLYPRATRCALASQSLWLLRTCAGARRRSRTTSSAITWASAARPSRCRS
jgi:hypothetical protein